MSTVRLTWQPADSIGPQTVIADIPDYVAQQMRDLIGTSAWTSTEAVMWISCRVRSDELMTKRLFRLARITDVTEAP